MELSKTGMSLLASIAFSFQGCASYADTGTATAPAATQAAAQKTEKGGGPALWKLADEDTTIYLFGTVHALPKDTEWYNGPIENALDSADELVTEIPVSAMQDPAAQQMVMAKALLPAGTTLREMLSEEDRATYEAALVSLGMPPAAFDRFEPWFAGMTLSVLPLMKEGYSPDTGVENAVEKLAGPDAKREALETLDEQIGIFDTLPEDSQRAFLMVSAENIDQIGPLMKRMVAEWLEGDSDALAELINMGLDDDRLANALLYNRNAKWAGWIDHRMDQPGTVFLAVGAGHLAGDKSVQDYLEERGFSITRVQ